MSNDERKALIEEANELALEFQPNIPTAKLQALVDEAMGKPPAVEETAPASPATKIEPEADPEPEATVEAKVKQPLSAFARKRQKIAESKKRAFKTQIVTLTNKDNRENDMMTTAYLSFENQYFGLSKIVPLDVPVELEASLISIAENTMITLHKDEVIEGKRTGNKRPVRVKKFAISYGKPIE